MIYMSLEQRLRPGRVLRLPDETTSVLAQGRRRVELVEFTQLYPYIRVRARVD